MSGQGISLLPAGPGTHPPTVLCFKNGQKPEGQGSEALGFEEAGNITILNYLRNIF